MDKWDRRFMQLVDTIATWSSCAQPDRKMGAVIVRNKRIVTTGYNGAPSGITPCVERGYCMRKRMGIPSGQRLEMCYAIHAEENAILQAAKLGITIDGATLYCSNRPCILCTKMIINAGIARVVYKNPYPEAFARELVEESGLLMEVFEGEDAGDAGDAGDARANGGADSTRANGGADSARAVAWGANEMDAEVMGSANALEAFAGMSETEEGE